MKYMNADIPSWDDLIKALAIKMAQGKKQSDVKDVVSEVFNLPLDPKGAIRYPTRDIHTLQIVEVW